VHTENYMKIWKAVSGLNKLNGLLKVFVDAIVLHSIEGKVWSFKIKESDARMINLPASRLLCNTISNAIGEQIEIRFFTG